MPNENAGYKIIAHIPSRNDNTLNVTAYNNGAPAEYVTWKYSEDYGFYWGHYFSNREEALDDMYERSLR